MSTTTRQYGGRKRLPKSPAAATTNTTQQQKKAKQSSPADQFWENTVKPRLELANRGQVEDLAKELFKELWVSSSSGGKKSATGVTVSFLKPLEEDKNKNLKMAGAWKFKGGELDIDIGIKGGSLVSSEVDIEGFSLESSSPITSPILIYGGDVDQYGCCRDSFEAELELIFQPTTDTIEGSVSVEPCNDRQEPEYGPDDAFGGSFEFIATRKESSK